MSGLEEVRARACPRARARPRPRLRPHCHSRRRRRPRRRPRRRLSSSTLRVRARAPCAPGAAAPLPRASAGRCRSTRTTSTSCPRASAGPPVGKAAVRPGRREPDTHRRAGVARVGLWRSQYMLHARGVSTAGVHGTPAPNGCLARRKAPAILFEGHRRLCREGPVGAPAHPGAPPRPLRGSPCPRQLARGRRKGEELPSVYRRQAGSRSCGCCGSPTTGSRCCPPQ